MDWITVAIQAGGAIGVCGMFLWFLTKKQVADDKARKEFLDHLEKKDAAASADVDRHMEYLRQRDSQSKEIAQSGHEALNAVAVQLAGLKESINRPSA